MRKFCRIAVTDMFRPLMWPSSGWWCILSIFVFLFSPPQRWPHEWPKHVVWPPSNIITSIKRKSICNTFNIVYAVHHINYRTPYPVAYSTLCLISSSLNRIAILNMLQRCYKPSLNLTVITFRPAFTQNRCEATHSAARWSANSPYSSCS